MQSFTLLIFLTFENILRLTFFAQPRNSKYEQYIIILLGLDQFLA